MSRRTSLIIAAAAAIAPAAIAAPAQADGFGCSASALRATVLGQVLEPVHAGAPDSCPAITQALDSLGAPLTADAASAQTGVSGQRAVATSALSGFKAGSLSALALPQIQIPAGLDALNVPLPAGGGLLGLPTSIVVDATKAAQQLVTERKLPQVPLLGADLVRTGVGAACDAGRTIMDSLSSVQGLTALGQSLPTDKPIDTAVPLAPAETVDFSKLDVGLIALPGGLSLADPVLGPILKTALAQVVAGLPKVSVPAAVGRVVVEPPAREQGADVLHQLGPHVRVEALGNEVADVQLGDALVSALGAVCTQPAAAPAPVEAPAAPELSPATELALSCAASDLVLTDVVEKDGKVKLLGLADGRYVGRTVDVVLTATGEKVASAVVEPDGWFRARAPLPARSIRFTNLARYQAVVDDQRSLALKLHRRMRISRMKPQDGHITITGRIYGRHDGDQVVISRRESCTKDVDLVTVDPDRDGRWRVTLPIPEGMEAATYRATTTVLKGSKHFRTFTLPGTVAF